MYQPGKQAKEAYVTIAARQRNANQPVKLPAAAKTARLSRPSASQSADTGWAKSCGWRNDLSRTHVLAKSLTGVRAPALATTTIRQKDLTVRYPKLEKEVKDVQQMHACLAAGEAIQRSTRSEDNSAGSEPLCLWAQRVKVPYVTAYYTTAALRSGRARAPPG